MNPFVVGIAGGSGSGKTFIAEALQDMLGNHAAVVLKHDSYYKDLSHLPAGERGKVNFDHPDALENELLAGHLIKLRAGEPIDVPVYDYVTHTRQGSSQRVGPKNIILAEGNFIFANDRLRKLFDLKVFLDVDPDVRFIRRLKRDIAERGRTVASIIEQYFSSVKEMHMKFIEPSKAHADLVVGNNEETAKAVQVLWEQVKCRIQ